MSQNVPSFIDVPENEQVTELRSFLKAKGAEISEENAVGGLQADLLAIIKASDVCWKESGNEIETETVINSVITLIPYLPGDAKEEVVVSLCEKLAKAQEEKSKNIIRIRLLSNVFHSIDDRSPYKYNAYIAMVRLAGQADLMHFISPNLDEVKKWVNQWDVSVQKLQNLLRALHEAFVDCGQVENATKAMTELLGTYTDENASQAREDAHKCIVTCLGDPSTYLLDHLLALKPVKFLEGEPIHDLLTIFVSGKLLQYMEFYESHKEFIKSLGLSHEQNLHKMRLLTFMQMAETRKEISFQTIQQEMRLNADEVESFIIDVVRTKAVRAKMDQMQRVVIISSTTHRTFGRQQWQLLRDQLNQWQQNLNLVQANLQGLAAMAQQH